MTDSTMGLKIVYHNSGEEMTVPVPAGFAIRAIPLWRPKNQPGVNPNDVADRAGETPTGEPVKITMMDLLDAKKPRLETDKGEYVPIEPDGWQFVLCELSTGHREGLARVASPGLLSRLQWETGRPMTPDEAGRYRDDIDNVTEHVAVAYLMSGQTTVRTYK